MDYYLAKLCRKGIRQQSMDMFNTPIVDTNTTPPRSPFSKATATPRRKTHLSYMSPSFDVYRQSPVDPTRIPPPLSSDDEDDEQEQEHYSYMVSLKQGLAASSVHLQPSVPDPRDEGTSDDWVPRNKSLIRLTGKHPFNCEPPLDVLMRHGFITPAPLHYVRNHGHVPKATWDNWNVEVSGLVRRETWLTMADLVVGSFPQSEFPVTITCSGNRRKEQNMLKKTVGFNWGPGAISTSLWRGIRLRDVLISCGVKRKHGLHVWFEGEEDLPAGGGTKYATSITLEVALDPSRDIMLAFMMNGDWLPPDHGYPVRMIVPGYTGGRMVKWLRRIIVTDKENDSHYHYKDNRVLPPHVVNAEIADAEGWWYKPEYVINEINTNSVITSPSHDEIVPINSSKPYTMKGYAYSGGGKKVTRVEVTFDGGETWRACNVDYPEKPNEYGKYWCWCFWSLDVEVLDLVGAKEVAVRAWDQSHSTQPSQMIWNLMGMMNNSWYRLKVSICRPRKGEIGLVFEQPVLPGNTTGGWMDKQKHMESSSYEGMKKSVSTPSMNTPLIRNYTISEVRKHCTKESAWIILHDNIYDCTPFLNDHPGGADSILINAGIDCTEEFDAIHSDKAKAMLGKYHIGELVETMNTQDSPNNSLANLLQLESVVKEVSVATSSSTSNIPQALIAREKVPCKLVMKTTLSHNVRLFRFALPTEKHILGLPVGKHIYVCAIIEDRLCMRAYTPTSKADEVGHFDLLVKIYFKNVDPKFPKGGLMSQHLESLSIGDTVDVKGPLGHIEFTGRGNFTVHNKLKSTKKLAMIAGGTGITPIYQVMQAALRDPEDETEMWVVCVNRSEDDVLLKEELDSWVEKYGDRVKVWHVIKESKRDGWAYSVGSLSEDVLREHVPVWSEGTLALACGPPGLIQNVVQPSLEKMGYDSKESLLVF